MASFLFTVTPREKTTDEKVTSLQKALGGLTVQVVSVVSEKRRTDKIINEQRKQLNKVEKNLQEIKNDKGITWVEGLQRVLVGTMSMFLVMLLGVTLFVATLRNVDHDHMKRQYLATDSRLTEIEEIIAKIPHASKATSHLMDYTLKWGFKDDDEHMASTAEFAESSRTPLDHIRKRETLSGVEGTLSLFEQYITWPQAESECVLRGGHLVSIHSQSDFRTVDDFANKVQHHGYWVGLNDVQTEGKLEWSDGSPVDYATFGNRSKGKESRDCYVVRFDGVWVHRLCTRKRPFVCWKPDEDTSQSAKVSGYVYSPEHFTVPPKEYMCDPKQPWCMPRTPPFARACDPDHQASVDLALANGMFGGGDGAKKNCGAWCIYDVYEPSTSAFYWNIQDRCFRANTSPCITTHLTELQYAIRRAKWLKAEHILEVENLEDESPKAERIPEDESPNAESPKVGTQKAETPEAERVLVGGRDNDLSKSGEGFTIDITEATMESIGLYQNQRAGKEMDYIPEKKLTAAGMYSMCKPWTSHPVERYPPFAIACNPDFQDRVELALANGMFGGGDGEEKNCAAWCLYDIYNPMELAFYWDDTEKCFGQDSAPCFMEHLAEWPYAYYRAKGFKKAALEKQVDEKGVVEAALEKQLDEKEVVETVGLPTRMEPMKVELGAGCAKGCNYFEDGYLVRKRATTYTVGYLTEEGVFGDLVPEAQVPDAQVPDAQVPEAQVSEDQVSEDQVSEDQVPQDGGCATTSGPRPHKPCVFPFIDKGVRYDACSTYSKDARPWCATETYDSGKSISAEWGWCDSSCPVVTDCSSGPTVLHGDTSACTGVVTGATCDVACDVGYHQSGIDPTCYDGGWLNIPSCKDFVDCTDVSSGVYCKGCVDVDNNLSVCKSSSGDCGSCHLNACLHSPHFTAHKFDQTCPTDEPQYTELPSLDFVTSIVSSFEKPLPKYIHSHKTEICGSSNAADLSPSAVHCSGEDTDATLRVRTALANGLFGTEEERCPTSDGYCLYDLFEPEKVAYKYNSDKGCYGDDTFRFCEYWTHADERRAAMGRMEELEKPVMLPNYIPTEDYITSICPSGSGGSIIRSTDARICSGNNAFTDRLTVSLANGMFGGADGADKNCLAWCVYDVFDPETTGYYWNGNDKCYRLSTICHSDHNDELPYAIEKSKELKQFGQSDEAQFPLLTATKPELSPQDEVHYVLTEDLMMQYCPDGSPGVDRSPDVHSCSGDLSETYLIRLALANGMFGSGDGADKNCGGWCLYDVYNPLETAYYWNPEGRCFDVRTGRICFEVHTPELPYIQRRSKTLGVGVNLNANVHAGHVSGDFGFAQPIGTDDEVNVLGLEVDDVIDDNDEIDLNFPEVEVEEDGDAALDAELLQLQKKLRKLYAEILGEES